MKNILYYILLLLSTSSAFFPLFPTKYSLRKYEFYIHRLEQKIKYLESSTFPTRPLFYGVYVSKGVNESFVQDNWCYTTSYPTIPKNWVCMGKSKEKSGQQELWIDPNNNTKYIHIVRNPFINNY